MSDSNVTECDLPVMGLAGVAPGIRSLAGRMLVDSLAEGDSVYVMSADSTESRIAAGTKRGKILILNSVDAFHYELSRVLDQGTPVLAIDWLDQDSLVVSDTTSRCLIWHAPYSSPFVLRSSNPVCAFVSTGRVRAGLTISGTILVWEHGLQAPPRIIEAPPPPKPYSFVNGVYWPACNSMLFPANDGTLTRIDAASYRVTKHHAHASEFYALQELDDGHMLSIGRRDRRACLWRAGSFSIESELDAPPGVVAIMLTGDVEAPIVLIHEDSRAVCYSMNDHQLFPMGEPTIADFRCGTGVSVDTYRKKVQQRREERINACIHELQAQLAAGGTTGCAEWVNALRAEGCEDLALAFEAEMAAVSGDVSAELARRVALCGLLPDTEGSVPSLSRLVHLCVRLFLYPKASETLKRIAKIVPNQDVDGQIARVERIVRVATAGQCIVRVQSIHDLLSLIEASDVVQSQWKFRAIVRKWDSIDCRDLRVCADDLVRTFRLLGSEDRVAGCVEVESANLHVVSGWQMTGSQEFVLFKDFSPEPNGFEVALQLETDGDQTVPCPVLLFSPATVTHAEGAVRHNQACISTINSFLQEGRGHRWISKTAGFAEHLLKRLIAEQLAQARRRAKV